MRTRVRRPVPAGSPAPAAPGVPRAGPRTAGPARRTPCRAGRRETDDRGGRPGPSGRPARAGRSARPARPAWSAGPGPAARGRPKARARNRTRTGRRRPGPSTGALPPAGKTAGLHPVGDDQSTGPPERPRRGTGNDGAAAVPGNAGPRRAGAPTGLYAPGRPPEPITPALLPPHPPGHNPAGHAPGAPPRTAPPSSSTRPPTRPSARPPRTPPATPSTTTRPLKPKTISSHDGHTCTAPARGVMAGTLGAAPRIDMMSFVGDEDRLHA